MAWEWMPPDLLERYAAMANQPAPPLEMQPGLGVPAAAVDAFVPPPPPEPVIGFPRPVGPDVPEDPAFAGAPNQLGELVPPMPWETQLEQPPVAQPGLGIPQQAVDDAVRAKVEQNLATGADPEEGFVKPVPEIEVEQPIDFTDPAVRAQTEQERIAALSNRDLALESFDREAERKRIGEAALAEAAVADRKRADDAARAYDESIARARQRRAEVEAEAAAMANDPKADWLEEGGLGRSISAVLMGIAGGLVQHLNGGRNIGIEMIDKAVDRYARGRQQKLNDKRASIADEMRDAAFDFEHTTAVRLAAYEHAKREATAQMAAFDPQGTQFAERAMFVRQLDAAQVQAAKALEEQAQKKFWDQYKLRLDLEGKALENANKEADLAKKLGKLGGAGTGTGVVHPPEYYEAQGLARPPMPMSDKDYKKWLGLKKDAVALNKGELELNKGEQDLGTNKTSMSREERELAIPGIRNKDGSPFLIYGRAEDASKLREQKAAIDNMVATMDEILRTRSGWSSDLGNSDERQALNVLTENLKIDAKNALDLGAITAADVPLIEGNIGTADASSWKDPTTAVKTARRKSLDRFNLKLKAAGYEGPRYDIIDTSAKTAPVKTETDKAQQRAMRISTGRSEDWLANVRGGGQFAEDGTLVPNVGESGLSIDQKANIDLLSTRGEVDALKAIVQQAENPAVRNYALTKLAEAEQFRKATAK